MEESSESLRVTLYEMAFTRKNEGLMKELRKDIRLYYDARQRERYSHLELKPRRKPVHKPLVDNKEVYTEGAGQPARASQTDSLSE
jgi:hypothetical protein